MSQGTTRAPDRRGFRTADGMILVAAVALGFALSGSLAVETQGAVAWPQLGSQVDFVRSTAARQPFSPWNLVQALSGFGISLWMFCSPFLATIEAALVPIRLLSPRPRRRRLALQPGTAAAIVAITAAACLGGFFGVARLASNKDAAQAAGDLALFTLWLPIFVGFSIASAWTTLGAAGLWRPEPSWIDRLGRIIGLVWIVAGVLNTCHYLIFGFSVAAGSVLIRYSA